MATKLIDAPWLVHFFHWRMFQDVGLAQVDYMTSVWLGSYRVVQCTCILVTVSLSVKLNVAILLVSHKFSPTRFFR